MKLLSQNEVVGCHWILGNYLIYRFKQELKKPDAEAFGQLLLEAIDDNLKRGK